MSQNDKEKKLTKKERRKKLEEYIEEQIKILEDLPEYAKRSSVNHYDLLTVFYMIHSLLD